jgi:hypothetical protein
MLAERLMLVRKMLCGIPVEATEEHSFPSHPSLPFLFRELLPTTAPAAAPAATPAATPVPTPGDLPPLLELLPPVLLPPPLLPLPPPPFVHTCAKQSANNTVRIATSFIFVENVSVVSVI